jgi:hypothetical protein
MPFVILLDHIANFPAEQFVDAIEAAGHGDEILNLKF